MEGRFFCVEFCDGVGGEEEGKACASMMFVEGFEEGVFVYGEASSECKFDLGSEGELCFESEIDSMCGDGMHGVSGIANEGEACRDEGVGEGGRYGERVSFSEDCHVSEAVMELLRDGISEIERVLREECGSPLVWYGDDEGGGIVDEGQDGKGLFIEEAFVGGIVVGEFVFGVSEYDGFSEVDGFCTDSEEFSSLRDSTSGIDDEVCVNFTVLVVDLDEGLVLGGVDIGDF